MSGIEEKIVPLTQLPKDKEAEIVRIYGGRHLIQKLCAMGMISGEFIKVINGGYKGPQICTVKGARYALGMGMANKIYVKYENETK